MNPEANSGLYVGEGAFRQLQHVKALTQVKAVGHCIVFVGLCLTRTSASTGELMRGAQLGVESSLQKVNFGGSCSRTSAEDLLIRMMWRSHHCLLAMYCGNLLTRKASAPASSPESSANWFLRSGRRLMQAGGGVTRSVTVFQKL